MNIDDEEENHPDFQEVKKTKSSLSIMAQIERPASLIMILRHHLIRCVTSTRFPLHLHLIPASASHLIHNRSTASLP